MKSYTVFMSASIKTVKPRMLMCCIQQNVSFRLLEFFRMVVGVFATIVIIEINSGYLTSHEFRNKRRGAR